MPGVEATLHEYKHGTLHSGSKHGPVVKSRAQAIAIALHEKGGATKHAAAVKSAMKGGRKK